MWVHAGKAILQGGTISESQGNGAEACSGGKITVQAEEHGVPQTDCTDNRLYDWRAGETSEIIGISREKVHAQRL